MSRTAAAVRAHVLSRWVYLGAILLVVSIVIVETLRFPGILTPPAVAVLYLSTLVLTLIAYVVMAFRVTSTRSPAMEVVLPTALRWGALVGALWWIEILEGNVWRLPGLWLTLFYFGPALVACIVPGIAAALIARQTGRFGVALMAGTWSGMVGSLLTFLGGSAILWVFNASFLHDPQNMREYLLSHARGLAPDLQTYIVGDLLAGLIAHLTLLGIALSALAGTIGAAIGKGCRPLAEATPKERQQPRFTSPEGV